MPINVLFVHSGDDWIRGSEAALLTLLRGLDRTRLRPFLLCDRQILADEAAKLEVRSAVHPIPQIMLDGALKLQGFDWVTTLRKLVHLAMQWKIDLFYCNGGRPCQTAYYAGKIRGAPVICHLHSPYTRRYILLYRFYKASKAIFVSRAIEQAMLAKQRFQAPCEVVHNGIDTDRFCPAAWPDHTWRARLGIPPDALVLGQVSSLITRKGIDVLLRAFADVLRQAPDAYLVLVGDGPQRSEFVQLANQLGIAGRVVFAGHQSDSLPYYQHVFDINVLASRSDAFPLSMLEAASCALPTIAARVDGIPEAVLDGRNGLLFEPENHRLLAQQIGQLARDRELCQRFGKAGRELAVERFSLRSFSDSIQRIIFETSTAFNLRAPAYDGILAERR